jgi:predicted alpha-1,2-mannosidase
MAVAAATAWMIAAPPSARAARADDLAAHVNPRIGTGGMVPAPPGKIIKYDELWAETPAPFGGLTYVGATLPFGMIALSPDSNVDAQPPYAWSGGKNAYDRTILGFSHMHQSGNGLAYGHFLFMPTAGPVVLEPGPVDVPEKGYRSRFRVETERPSPGHYAVRLDDEGIDVELTVTARTGLHRYEFPSVKDAHVIVDLQHAIGFWKNVNGASLEVVDGTTILGTREAQARSGGARPFAFAATFSRPFSSYGIEVDGKVTPGQRRASGKAVKAHFDFDTTKDRVVFVKVAVSPVGVDGALANLTAEQPGWDFAETKRQARQVWNEALGKIEVRGGSAEQRRVFYTALYHSQLAPFVLGDADGHYRGSDGQIHRDGFTNYTFFSLWDTFRAQQPLLTLVAPERVPDMLRSMMAIAERGGGLPGAGLAGHHAAPVFADAYLKGIRGFDAERAFALVKRALTSGARGLDSYQALGWVAADKEPRASAHTLEYALDDWAAAELARALGKTEDDAFFRARSGNWRHVIDPKVGFARGRLADGSWRTPFDPRAVSHYQKDEDFVEANAWQYTFYVPHDGRGLAQRLGGRARLAARLDELFDQASVLTGTYSADVTGLWGQYAAGNEQSHHIAYLYAWAGEPWKTQWRVRELMTRFYTDTPEGLAGNDDAGATSAWYVWSALGFYPVNPVGGVYVIGSPLFESASIDVGDGKRFEVAAKGNGPVNLYIQSATLNGRPLDRTFITHAEVLAGGRLEFVMGPTPNRRWAASPTAAPPSASDPGGARGSVVPRPAGPRRRE